MPYDELIRGLAPLETFEAAAFIGDSSHPQELCDFILTLALAYNDFHDLILLQNLINEIDTERGTSPSTKFGQNVALRQGLMRVQVGFIHELLKLVEAHKVIIAGPSFAKVFRLLSKAAKKAWTSIYDVACGKNPNDKLARALVRIRNNMSFHYDAAELARGYTAHFFKDHPLDKPYISRGGTLGGTRFYFADASVEGYLRLRIAPEDKEAADFLFGGGDLLDEVNLAIHEIVIKFIQMRSAFRKFEGRA